MLEFKEPSFVTIGGRKLAYDEVSPPNPKGNILLLTGLGSKRLAWYNQMPDFGKYYRVIALDHRDVGDSDQTLDHYNIGDQANDAAAVLQALGITKTHVVGISMGGFISLELTLRNPQLVDKLVLTSTSGGGITNVPASPRLWGGMLFREKLEVGELARKTYTRIMAPGYAQSHPERMEEIIQIARYRPMSREAYARQFRACLQHNVAFRLNQIKAPTLVIHGDKDPLVPIPNGRRLARKIPGAKFIVYPGIGHIPIIENAERYNQDVLAFLGE
jgi:pimeloyl-ACP methyl ester carboxylesterase